VGIIKIWGNSYGNIFIFYVCDTYITFIGGLKMIITGYKKSHKSITIKAESENIMEFIHIFDRNGKRIGLLTIFNSHSGKTKVEYDDKPGSK